jgi:hypothetical protein
MRATLIVGLAVIFFILCQGVAAISLELEWEYSGRLGVMGDMNGNGSNELISRNNFDTDSIFDPVSYTLQWTISDISICPEFRVTEGYLMSSYDLTGDGVNELVGDPGDSGLVVYDVALNTVVYTIDKNGATNTELVFWGDIDSDGNAELIVFFTYETDWITDSVKTRIYETGEVSGVDGGGDDIPFPKTVTMDQNYPNPFNPSTTIAYQVQRAAHVKVIIYNSLGQLVNTLVDEQQNAGEYSIQWDGASDSGEQTASGVYFYQLQVDDFTATKKMVLLK